MEDRMESNRIAASGSEAKRRELNRVRAETGMGAGTVTGEWRTDGEDNKDAIDIDIDMERLSLHAIKF